jgi:Zn-dependent protease
VFGLQPTPLDLRFRLFRFPVTVSPWFWLTAVFLGWGIMQRLGPVFLLLWVACVFVSILAHELGHGLVYRLYRVESSLALIAFGGLAIPDGGVSRWRQIAVSLAGPGIQLVIVGLLYVSHLSTGWAATNDYTAAAYLFLSGINLWWAMFNLLPVWPLDGGRVSREVWHMLRVRRPDVTTYGISLLTAGTLTAFCVMLNLGYNPGPWLDWIPFKLNWLGTLFMAMFAYQSYLLLQQASRPFGWEDRPDDYDQRWR